MKICWTLLNNYPTDSHRSLVKGFNPFIGGARVAVSIKFSANLSVNKAGVPVPVLNVGLSVVVDIFQKLSSFSTAHREIIVDNGAHKSLVMLLSAPDNITLLHCALYALHDLAQRLVEPR